MRITDNHRTDDKIILSLDRKYDSITSKEEEVIRNYIFRSGGMIQVSPYYNGGIRIVTTKNHIREAERLYDKLENVAITRGS